MSIMDFELFHGLVLTKIVRSGNPVTLRMIETNTSEAWSAYRINDASFLYIKYRTGPRKTKRPRGLAWAFIFGKDELRQIKNLKQQNPVYLALVCINKEPHSVCFLEPEDVEKCMDVDARTSQSITVLYQRRKALRVYGPSTRNDDTRLAIPRNRLRNWIVPGG